MDISIGVSTIIIGFIQHFVHKNIIQECGMSRTAQPAEAAPFLGDVFFCGPLLTTERPSE